jgi:hypothetical protein
MNCPDCGIEVERDAEFCPKCFARIERPGLLRRIMGFFQHAAKPGSHVIKSEKTVNIVTVDKDGNRHEYHSLNEVPLAMRSQFEKLESEVLKDESKLFTVETLKELKGSPGIISKKSSATYKIKDGSGEEHIYHSLDEVPPEMRPLMEKMQSGTITADDLNSFGVYKIKDASGQERTYHSLEELPPEIKKALEKIHGAKGKLLS